MKPPTGNIGSITVPRFIKWCLIGFVFWIGWLILTPFPHYLPPDFEFGFLSNKGAFFYRSGYFLGFYLHIFAAPLGLLTGGLQMSRTIRRDHPSIHRSAGRIYAWTVLIAAAPGGLIMSTKAYGGWSTTICFAWIAIATWMTTAIGWRAARGFDYQKHAIWMLRSYTLMLSAVFLRLGHYFLQPLGMDPELTYQVAAWASWIVPSLVLEATLWARRRVPGGSR